MKKRNFRFLSLLLVFVMIIGMLPLSASAAVGDNEWAKRTENTYLTQYSKRNFPAEYEQRFDSLTETNYWITLDGKDYVAFCFNKKKTDPHAAKYEKKYENANESQFRELAEDAIDIEGVGFKNAVLWAVYLGYPYKKGNFEERATQFYGIPEQYAEDAVHFATQMAIWHFTDYKESLKKYWSNSGSEIFDQKRMHPLDNYDKTLGDPITYLAADLIREAIGKSNEAPNMELDLYNPANNSKRQNLLVTTYTETKDPEYGKLKISKKVKGNDNAFDQKFQFTVILETKDGDPLKGEHGKYNFDERGQAQIEVSQNDPVVLDKLPEGTKYTVNEETLEGWTISEQKGTTGTIVANDQKEAHFVNTANKVDVTPKFGSLEISKEIKGKEDARTQEFSFTVTLTDKDDKPLQGKYGDYDFNEKGETTIKVTPEKSVIIDNLPEGTQYTVEEELLDGWKVTEKTGDKGSITADEKKEAHFVNTAQEVVDKVQSETLTIQKKVTGDTASSDTDEFHFQVVLTQNDALLVNTACTVKSDKEEKTVNTDASGALDLAIIGPNSVSITGLPTGTEYWVGEKKENGSYTSTEDTTVENGYTLADVTGNEGILTKPMTAVFTNHKKTTDGSLTLFKGIEGNLSSTEDEFSFRVTLTKPDGTPLTGTYMNQDGEPVDFTPDGTAIVKCKGDVAAPLPFVKILGLPTGTQYQVEEFTGISDKYTADPATEVEYGYTLDRIQGNAAGTINTAQTNVTFWNKKVSSKLAKAELTIEKTIADGVTTEDVFAFDITLKGDGAVFTGARDGVDFLDGHATVYITGADKKVITDLPACDFTIAERQVDGWVIPAPKEGTLQDGSNETIVFENRKATIEPTAISITVKKEWKLDDGGIKGDAVTVDLVKDGIVEQTVVLGNDNNWTHTWSGLEANHTWTVNETDVPSGFKSSISEENGIFTILNDDIPSPDEPNQPRERHKREDSGSGGGSEEHVREKHETSASIHGEIPTTPQKPDVPETSTNVQKTSTSTHHSTSGGDQSTTITENDASSTSNASSESTSLTNEDVQTTDDTPSESTTITNEDTQTTEDTPVESSTFDSVPKTGDASHVSLWLILSLLFSSTGAALLFFRKRSPDHMRQ